jgi:uncharacterized protein YigE (DUF2233 family)
MRYFILVIYFIGLFIPVQAQKEKTDLVYRNAKFDIIEIKLDSSVTNNFAISNNTAHLSEKAYFDSLAHSLQAPFFAITASIVDSACNPLGLYIQNNNKIRDINNDKGNGNFFLKPNGIISIDTANKIEIKDASTYSGNASYKYALQSGPMLITNGTIHPGFDKNSNNKFVRCGVGIYTDKNNNDVLVFIRSKEPVSFYQLAQLFQEKYKCKNALTLESGGYCSTHFLKNNIPFNDKLSICRFIIISF